MWAPRSAGVRLAGLAALLLLNGCAKSTEPGEPGTKEMPPVAVEMAEVTEGAMDRTVTAQGTLAPSQGGVARLAAATPGRLLTVTVREGEAVTAGQVVATLDLGQVQAQARSARSAVATAGAQARQAEMSAQAAESDHSGSLETARLSLASARQQRDGAVLHAQAEVAAAEIDLAKARAGARPQEVALADQAVEQAAATQERAASELQRQQFLFSKGVTAKRQVEDAVTAARVASAALEAARQQAALLRAGTRSEEIRALEIRVRQARDDLALAQASGASAVACAESILHQAERGVLQVAAKRQEALAAREAVAEKRADLAGAEASSSYSAVRAPFSGRVARRYLNPGDMTDPSTPILEITGSKGMDLVAGLPTGNGSAVRAGMPARITSPDDPGMVVAGHVLSVGQVDPQGNLLSVRITFDRANRWRTGAFASAEIVLETHRRAALIPRAAVLTREDRTVVYVVSADGIAHETPVTLGPERGDLVEVRMGLRAGQQVIRLGQYELADGARVSRAPAPGEAKAPGDD